MNIPIEPIDLSFVRNLSKRFSRRYIDRSPSYCSKEDFSSLKYEQLVPDNLVEINEQECLDILKGNKDALKSPDEVEGPPDAGPPDEVDPQPW